MPEVKIKGVKKSVVSLRLALLYQFTIVPVNKSKTCSSKICIHRICRSLSIDPENCRTINGRHQNIRTFCLKPRDAKPPRNQTNLMCLIRTHIALKVVRVDVLLKNLSKIIRLVPSKKI